MHADRWEVIEQLCQEALDRPKEQQEVFLESACGQDQELRREVESLLAHRWQAENFIEAPAMELAARALAADQHGSTSGTSRQIGRLISHYRIVEEVASGGMGDVYRAVRADGTYDKQVAIKLIQGARSTDFFLARFQNERQILADLDHPNIARLIDGGTTEEGLPYVVMEYVQGLPIDEFCKQKGLTVRERLEVFRTVCSAVHYAHQSLVVHRDLKPSNILVTADGVPKLLDFGIAKMLNPHRGEQPLQQTVTVMRMLTPHYASPEQLRNEPISTASDIYSLGVILYELLTGLSPYRVATDSPQELMKAICDTQPEKPSAPVMLRPQGASLEQPSSFGSSTRPVEEKRGKLRKVLAGDLDNIVLNALRKEPQRRYSSAEQFSEDIRRYLVGLPVVAHEDSLSYRARKFAARHKLGVAAVLLLVASLAGGLVSTLSQAHVAKLERARAERRFNDVRTLANSLIFEIHDSIQNLPGATPSRKLLLDRALQYLDSLATESAGDFSLQRELAAAYQRIGQLQGNTLDANLGQTDAAITSLQKAQAIAESVAQANPANLSDQLRVANGHRMLASMLNNTGRAGARSQTEKAIEIAERLLKLDASNPQVLLEKASGYEQLAFFQDEAGDAAASLQSFRNALAIDEGFWKADSDNRELQEKVAVLRVRIGNLLRKLGFRDEALQSNRSGLDVFESLVTDQTDARNRRRLAVASVFRGNIQMMDGEVQDALASFRRSLPMLQDLERADPHNVLYHLDVAGATASVGRALASTGKRAEGLAMLQEAIGVLQENYARDHSYTDIPYWLGQDHIWSGEILARAGHARGALDEYHKGVSSLESLESGTVSPNTRCDIAASYTKVGAGYAAVGNDNEASTAYRKALEIAEPLVLSKPANVLGLYAAADAYFGMGELAKSAAQGSRSASHGEEQHHWREACDWYRKSMDAWRQIPNPGRTTPSGFATLDPTTLAGRLRACDAMHRGSEQPRK